MSNHLKNFSKQLRKNLTDTERLLWKHLRAKRLEGLKFKRQETIGNYIVDFICYQHRLIVELDGGHHTEQEESDQRRDQWLRSQGFQVLRFWNNEVLKNLKGVLQLIVEICHGHPPPHPLPSREGGGSGILLFLFFFCLLFTSSSVLAREKVVITSLSKPKGKIEKHFDKDKDGFLNVYERMLLRTYVVYRYPLVKKKKQRPYDVNGSLMLEPAEYKRYLQDEATGKLKTEYREYKREQKALKRLEREVRTRAKKLGKNF